LNIMRHLILGCLLMSFFLNGRAQENIYRDLTVPEFKTKMDSVSKEVLLDLRTPEEISKGIIPGAVNLDYFKRDFEKQLAGLDRAKPYFLYCTGGGRSGETLELMKKLGFKEVYNLKDGFTGWTKNKMPVGSLKK
jgi:rhodanese-related sulfurtransferase